MKEQEIKDIQTQDAEVVTETKKRKYSTSYMIERIAEFGKVLVEQNMLDEEDKKAYEELAGEIIRKKLSIGIKL